MGHAALVEGEMPIGLVPGPMDLLFHNPRRAALHQAAARPSLHEMRIGQVCKMDEEWCQVYWAVMSVGSKTGG